MRTWALSLVGAAATALGLGALLAQPADTGTGGPPGAGGKGPRAGGATSPPGMHRGDPNAPGGGFHLIPPFAAERMKLTEDQRKQLEELAKETKAKLDKILTPEQQKILQEARPPRPGEGPGGPGGGPGRGPGRGPGGGPGGGGAGRQGGPPGGGAGGQGGRPPSE